MNALLDEVRREIVGLHVFFTEWFTGVADRTHLDARFLSHMHPDLTFIPPDRKIMGTASLKVGFEQAYGSNPGFRIQICDVAVRHHSGEHLLVTYTEWQTGAKASINSDNARFSTAFMYIGAPIQWLHLQEAWLPEKARAAGSFNF